MKLNIVPLTVIAGIAITHVKAAPVVVEVVSFPYNASPNEPDGGAHIYRLGHAAGVGTLRSSTYEISESRVRYPKYGCGARMRAKAAERMRELSNSFRAALGLPLIEAPPKAIHIASMPSPHHQFADESNHIIPDEVMLARYKAHRIERQSRPFLMRLQRGLDMLGPWEGRAVAFVIGCGIGVLIRMLFVFAVLMVRSAKCAKRQATVVANDQEHSIVEAEVLFVAPPAYSPDNKVAEPSDLKEVAVRPEISGTQGPMTDTWEGFVARVDTVENAPEGLQVYWTSVDGHEFITPASTFAQMCPKQLISFYESNLKWKSDED